MQGSGQKDGSQLLERLISDEESEEVKVDTVDPKWNILDLIKLALCWALTLTTSTLLTTVGPLAAKKIGASDILAPFTIGTFLIGAAVSSVPSGPLFRKYGRYGGFAVGCFFQIAGSVSGMFGMLLGTQFLLFLGCFAVGMGQGLGQFYRFAAVEISPPDFKSRAVTYVLSGGIIAAFLGPTSANYSVGLIHSSKYAGSFLIMGLIGIVNWLTLYSVNFPKKDETLSPANPLLRRRSVYEIVSHPVFILSCTVATIAHTVMVAIMSNCAISMDDDYSFRTTSLVLELHFLAMFLPGFFTGKLIQDYGTFNVCVFGAVMFAMSSVIFALGNDLWNYLGGMMVLGFAWNLSFSAGTIMLTTCYAPHEAADVQAINDFILFTVAGAGSLLSGVIYSQFSWAVLIYVSAVMMAINLLLFTVAWKMKSKFDSPEGTHKPYVDDECSIGDTDKESAADQGTYNRNISVASMSSITSAQNDERERVRSMSVA